MGMIYFCRLCAEQKKPAELIASVFELNEKLIKCCRWQETNDENRLPQRVCDRCVVKLDVCSGFVDQIEAAKVKFYSMEPVKSEEAEHDEFTIVQVGYATGMETNNESQNKQSDIGFDTDVCLRRSNKLFNKPHNGNISKTLIFSSDGSNESNNSCASYSDSASDEFPSGKSKDHQITDGINSQTSQRLTAMDQVSQKKNKSYKFLSRIPHETLLPNGSISEEGVSKLEQIFPEMKTVSWETCKYKCEKCQQVIEGSNQFFIHFQSKHYDELDSYRFVCFYCSGVHDGLYRLNCHIGSCTHYPHLKYRCSICPKMYFWNLNILRKHNQSHAKTQFKCYQCEKSVFGKVALYRHIRSMHLMNDSHQNRIFTCDICKAVFSMKNSIKNHIMIKHAKIKSFVCQYCNKPFGAKADLNYHIEARHIVPKDFFVCSIANCGKQFNTNVKLKAHLLTHGPRQLVICEHCGNEFVSAKNLKDHIEAKHLAIFYTCPIKGCERKFKWKMSLKNHILRHEPTKKLQCNICNNYLASKKSLRGHMSIHDNTSKSHNCFICDKSFRTKTKLNIHERIHSGLRPFQCPLCTYTSADSGNLEKHTKRIHSISMKQNL